MSLHRFLFNDRFTTQTNGGITVYYIAPKKATVTAFKPVSLRYCFKIHRLTRIPHASWRSNEAPKEL